MKYLELKKLIKEDTTQVFLMRSKCSFPVNFVTHNYFLVSKKGKLFRYEIAFEKNKKQKELGHLHINVREPLEGNSKIFGIKNPKWDVEMTDYAEGKIANKLVAVLEKTPTEYKDKHNYKLRKCNCNTFAQRIINQVSECKFKLPDNAIGKDKA